MSARGPGGPHAREQCQIFGMQGPNLALQCRHVIVIAQYVIGPRKAFVARDLGRHDRAHFIRS